MRPIKLTMQAFGSYAEKTTVDFSESTEHLFLVTGDTGAGKTTIFDAIVFALYGEASSVANKKEGVLLQSQYADVDVCPEVTLTFSDGSADDVYEVRRVPRHVRRLKKASAKGNTTKEEPGSVELTLPDGTICPAKETDARLEEIVGLSKSQFMQIAMIAQGEFMELLRAKSDTKKEIFRRLFHTELYENIVREFDSRKKEKEKEIAIIRTQTQTLIGRVRLPEDYEYTDELLALQRQIEQGTLETYVQRYYLEQVLYAANSRFSEMSAGQFELRMYDIEKAGEGKNRGLDLMVYSTVTGREREIRTLSGGESFMAALALALGMADQIQMQAAAINLDILFIDEGFGSLDEHSRGQAVRVLKNMAEGKRLIGIISHVTELKQEIDNQLVVTRDEKGSHVVWQH